MSDGGTAGLVPAVEDESGMWAYQVCCPGGLPYRSPFIYPSEHAALDMRRLELQMCDPDGK